MDKEQRLPSVLKNFAGNSEVICGDGFCLADKTRELNAVGRRPDGRDEALKRLRGPRGPERKS